MYNKKVCILGASGVGKSSLVQQFLNGKFNHAYRRAHGGAKIDKIVVDVDRDKVQLMLWNIQGEDKASRGYLNYIQGASAIIYVVDGTRLKTLDTAIEFRQQTENHLGSAKPSIMLFNKSDLAEEWVISPGMISNVESNGIFTFLTSCREGSSVNTAFSLITRVMMGRTALMPALTLPPLLQDADPHSHPRY